MDEGSKATDATRTRLLEAQGVLLDGISQLRDALDHAERDVTLGRAHVRAGHPASELPHVGGLAMVGPSLNSAIERLEEARLQTRVEVFTLAWQEGLSFEEIAQSWQISRQLVSRIMNSAGRRATKRGQAS